MRWNQASLTSRGLMAVLPGLEPKLYCVERQGGRAGRPGACASMAPRERSRPTGSRRGPSRTESQLRQRQLVRRQSRMTFGARQNALEYELLREQAGALGLAGKQLDGALRRYQQHLGGSSAPD